MEKYVFSGSLTQQMHDLLQATPGFEPIDILVSQLDRSAISKMIQWKHEGFCRWLFIDSGAFSVHTGKASVTVDQYIEYLNSIDADIDVFAQLDTIPGKFGQPKSRQDYEQSAKLSWENFLYMYERVKSPCKLMPVFHYGESFDALKNMLSWHDAAGQPLSYIGISPANDASQSDKNTYMRNVSDIIAKSENPHVKTHLYGMTSLDALSKYPCYSADSISHRLISGYCKILSSNFGVISVSKKQRTSATKSNMSFLDTCDSYNYSILEKEMHDLGFTIEEVQESSAVRTVVTMRNIQKLLKSKYQFDADRVKRPKKLFEL